MKDDSPDAWVIMLVGNSSGVTKKTAPNVPDAPTMPSIADTTDSVLVTNSIRFTPELDVLAPFCI